MWPRPQWCGADAFDYDDYAKAVGCDWLVFDEVTTVEATVVELLCQ